MHRVKSEKMKVKSKNNFFMAKGIIV